jgi:hypothetical protein
MSTTDDIAIFRTAFRSAVDAACREWSYPQVAEEYFRTFGLRIPAEIEAVIGDGVRRGRVGIAGYLFSPAGLGSAKGPYKLVGRYTSRRRPSPHWEYFVQLAEFLRLDRELVHAGYSVGFEDGLMDVTVRMEGELLWCIEVKEQASRLRALRVGLDSYASRVPMEASDRGNDSLRKAKYLVRHRPRYLSLVAIGAHEHFEVSYPNPTSYSLVRLASEPDLRALEQ